MWTVVWARPLNLTNARRQGAEGRQSLQLRLRGARRQHHHPRPSCVVGEDLGHWCRVQGPTSTRPSSPDRVSARRRRAKRRHGRAARCARVQGLGTYAAGWRLVPSCDAQPHCFARVLAHTGPGLCGAWFDRRGGARPAHGALPARGCVGRRQGLATARSLAAESPAPRPAHQALARPPRSASAGQVGCQRHHDFQHCADSLVVSADAIEVGRTAVHGGGGRMALDTPGPGIRAKCCSRNTPRAKSAAPKT